MLDALVERLRGRDRLALARLLTMVDRGEDIQAIRAQLPADAARARVIALTGSGGVGKSTLIGKLIDAARRTSHNVAVLACDPQSPLTGGALLGDRVRMNVRADDSATFIRSVAVASGGQAIAEHLDDMIRLLDAFGFDVILLETAGSGQGDTAVRDLADVVVLLLQPESGDELQWEKAGLIEVADVLVVNKCDLPGAEQLEKQLRDQSHFPGSRPVPVVCASGLRGRGIDELWAALEACPARRSALERDGRALLRIARQRLIEQCRRHPEQVESLLERWKRGELSDAEAAEALLRALGDEQHVPERKRS